MADVLFILSYYDQSKVVVLIAVINGLVRKVPDAIIRHICVLILLTWDALENNFHPAVLDPYSFFEERMNSMVVTLSSTQLK